MFCPMCGKDNPNERKFCSTCGTNLETVAQALSGEATNFFARLDSGLDHFIARYSEHVFKDAPSNALDRRVSNSWKLLGKGVVTSLVDVFLALFIWNVFTLRFQILWISTPFRLLAEKSKRQKNLSEGLPAEAPLRLPEPAASRWLPSPAPSVAEHTTERLRDYQPPRKEPTAPQD